MTAKEKKKIKEKKNKFIKKVKTKLAEGEPFDEATANELAAQWFELADIDGNGWIDQNEFEQLVTKLDESEKIP